MLGKITVSQISKYLNYDYFGDNLCIDNACSIANIKENSVSFISKKDYYENLNTKALIIVFNDYEINQNSMNTYIKVDNPRLAFAKVIEKFFYKKKEGISPRASIHSNVQIGDGCYIGDNVVIEENVIIGENTIIEHNTAILKNINIGNNCYIGANCVIGNDGLGTANDNNELIMIRHLGGVTLEDGVEIGASSTVGRGTLDNTIIKQGTKIGPQVNIGHNSIVGKNCQIAGRSHLSGSVKIGDGTKLWANSIIKDGIAIGENCTVGIGAVVTSNIEDNITVMGLEALPLKKLVKFKKDSNYKK